MQRLLGALGAALLALIHWTVRWRIVGLLDRTKPVLGGEPFVLAFWHGRQLMMPWIYPLLRSKRRMHVLISEHRDGQLISNIISHFGLYTIAGSSTHGGSRALIEIVQTIKRGELVSITPDGPRGPVYQAKPGILAAAALAGCQIVPCAFSTERRITFGSWDRMCLPRLFTRGVYVAASPVTIKRERDPQAEAAALADFNERLSLVTRFADFYAYD